MNPSSVYVDALQAGQRTADTLTSELRDTALKQGWPQDTADGLSIIFTGEGFSIEIAPEVEATVERLEYGTESLEPNPVIRTFSLRPSKIDSLYMSNLQKEAGFTL